MMDAKEFLKEWERMCNSTNCKSCGLLNSEACGGMPFGEVDFDEMVAKVEKWSKEHPLVTNGDKVMEIIKDAGVPVTARGSGFDREDPVNTVHIAVSEDWWDAEYKEEE